MTNLPPRLERLQRINVVGTSSSGKSTFARRLANVLACPHVELDRLFWKPGWQQATPDEFKVRLEQAIGGKRWVIDGNYNTTQPIQHDRLTMVVWLDYSLVKIFPRAFHRAIRRSWTGQEVWPDTGNRESFRRNFASLDSVLLWTLTSFRRNRKKYLAMMKKPELSSIEFIRLRHPRQAEIFLQTLEDTTRTA